MEFGRGLGERLIGLRSVGGHDLVARRDRQTATSARPPPPSDAPLGPLRAARRRCGLTDVAAEVADLLDDELAHALDVVLRLEAEVELASLSPARLTSRRTHLVRTGRLVGRIVPDLQIRVLKRALARDTLVRVESEQTAEQVERVRVGARVHLTKGHAGLVRQAAKVLLGARAADAPEGALAGGAEDVQDLVELVDVVAAFEDRSPAQQLGEDAADRVDVD